MALVSGRFVLGSDIGAGSCMTALLEVSGRVLATDGDDYPTLRPWPGWAVQDPEAGNNLTFQQKRR